MFVACVCSMTVIAVQGIQNEKSYFDCKVYFNKEERPVEKAECVYDYREELYYCKTWECEVPSCPREEQVDQEGEPCPLCQGTCTTGGKIYSVGETVTCVDGSNRCGCVDTGRAISTYAGTNKYMLCGAPFNSE